MADDSKYKEMEEMGDISDVHATLRVLLTEVRHIQSRLDKIEGSTTNMDEHISFVEGVYMRVKSPFSRLLSLIGRALPAGDEDDCGLLIDMQEDEPREIR
jgi:hypothetical protein